MTESVSFMGTENHTEAADNAAKARVQKNNGYIVGVSDELEVIQATPAAMSVIVGKGEAWVQGVQYINDAAKTITVDAADATHPRIDRIILRLTWAADTCEAVYLKGTAAASPSAPALTQTSAVHEISLAQFLIPVGKTSILTGDITDERNTAYCGQAACNLGTMHINADGSLDAASLLIHSVADPESAQDASTKAYTDGKSGWDVGDVKYTALDTFDSTHWLEFTDTAVSRTTYAALFSAIGTKFGAGDGTTTFNIPSPGLVPVAYKSGDANFGTMGAKGGEATHLLTAAESGEPGHNHSYPVGSAGGGGAVLTSQVQTGTADVSAVAPASAAQAHNNLQPYQVFRGLIRYV